MAEVLIPPDSGPGPEGPSGAGQARRSGAGQQRPAPRSEATHRTRRRSRSSSLPRLGFLGVGWIGRARMESAWRAGVAEIAAVADLDAAAAGAAAESVGCSDTCSTLEELLARDLDGVVIATPTALHADQVRRALSAGVAVFCQKPLGRSAGECARVISLARESDVLLGVDMSYRQLRAVQAALRRLRQGAIGTPHAAELVFHNAYGPDKPWVRDVTLAGGGALIDLGWHLLDLAQLFLGPLDPVAVQADLFAAGQPLGPDPRAVEDLVLAQMRLGDGRVVRLACSWWLPAGTDALIEASFFGAGKALTIRNVGGSFYDFESLLVEGRTARQLVNPPDDWGGRALAAWARQLARDGGFDPAVEGLETVAALIDQLYGRDPGRGSL